MIKSVREVMSYWNEGGLIISLCALSGWFGSRYQLGWLPAVIAVSMFFAGALISWILANSNQGEEFAENNGTVDRFIWLWLAFSVGQALCTTLGALL